MEQIHTATINSLKQVRKKKRGMCRHGQGEINETSTNKNNTGNDSYMLCQCELIVLGQRCYFFAVFCVSEKEKKRIELLK